MSKKPAQPPSLVRSSAAEYLTFVAASGSGGVEAVYADESIWLSQKMMGLLYDVETQTINYHLKKIFADNELQEASVIRNFRITETEQDWRTRLNRFEVNGRKIQEDAGKVTAEIAKAHAESEFEQYRIMQDRLFESDFDRMLKQVEAPQELEGGNKKADEEPENV